MDDQNKMMPRPLFLRGDPFHDWTMPSRLFNRDLEFPPFLDERDLNWLEWAQKRLAATSWPGYRHAPVISPPGSHPSTRAQSQVTEGTSELVIGQGTWRVSLDINQFTPEDITVRTKDGYLEITGKHEERQDAHGLVSRSFNRKYRLQNRPMHIKQGFNYHVLYCQLKWTQRTLSAPCHQGVCSP
ncbi:heat shock protein beta-1-like isoform X2 [Alosa alosa]|uniref:heat shock protein beta-1-like isoform X2 n=1 Tax=Alosa sapidissima TaxID=34773 RepID=UPI001C09DBA0|nr:heat shock protein beta-1-like isoform X2 [Alosa sapidissima]XP_048114480.1 heat shock protein beta-1-like isoform X2 [Alosa alosa]